MFKGSNTKLIDGERVKGLLVGINYIGTKNQLGGSINDVLAIEQLIRSTYLNAQLELLTDETLEKPTRDNILKKLKQLVAESQDGDILVFSYSGHGSQMPDINGDKTKEIGQTVCPIDFMDRRVIIHNGKSLIVDRQIFDYEINEIIDDVRCGVKFLMLADACRLESSRSPISSPNQQQGVDVISAFSPKETYSLASWVYVNLFEKEELWLTPFDQNLYEQFGNAKHVVAVPVGDNKLSPLLLNDHNIPKTAMTIFKALSDDSYQVSCPELGINNVTVKLRVDIDNSQSAVPYQPQAQQETQQEGQGSAESIQLAAASKLQSFFSWLPWLHHKKDPQDLLGSYFYNPVIGKHYHFNQVTGKKRTLNMRSPRSCYGGELRIINGYRDDENSSDIGINGACTMAFLETVEYLGGFQNFLEKMFSDNVQYFRLVENGINNFLSKFEFTKQSDFSWKNFSYPSTNAYTCYDPHSMQVTPITSMYQLPINTTKKRKFAVAKERETNYAATQLYSNLVVYQPSTYTRPEDTYPFNKDYQINTRPVYKLT